MPALEAAARQGNPRAAHELANLYRDGNAVPVDRQKAFDLYTASAAKGLADSDYELSKFYNGRFGGKIDLIRSRQHLQSAAERGNNQAQVDLAFIHLNGAGSPKNLPQAFRWFDAAAHSNSVLAQCMLGDFYRGGWGGVKQDHKQALSWYRKTANTSDRCASKSQYELYVSYEAGLGVQKDMGTAIRWLKKSADAGNPQAQRALAVAYHRGAGVPQDAELAKKWMLKSREGVAPHDDHEHDDHDEGAGDSHTHARKHKHAH